MKDHDLRISFEFYPPKSEEGFATLSKTATLLSKFTPAFFSVTFGAGGATREGTVETVKMLQQKTEIAVAPHLSCIGSSRENLISILKQYLQLNIIRIVALRGDLPSGMVSRGDLLYARDLVQLIREITGDAFLIEVAAYPEYHPQAKNAIADIQNLKRKFAAGANSAITQFFFNPDAYFYFLDECAKEQIFMPIVPGIMPILQFSKLVRFSEMCGAEIPRWLYKRLEAYGDDLVSIRNFGLEFVLQLCERLLAGGAPGLHFYTLNQADLCVQLVSSLNMSVKEMPEVV